MNWFASFAVLLMVTQAPVPVPRQASNSSAARGGNANGKSQSDNAPAAPLVALVDPICPTKDQCSSGKQTDDNTTHSIVVREFPTVSISKDWADRGVWWFSFFLVVVGAAQAFYVAKTLSAIKEQAKSLKRQNDMIVSKERARLSIEVEPHALRLEDGPEWTTGLDAIYTEATFSVTNLGATNAFNVLAYGSLYSSDSRDPPHPITKKGLLSIPSVIKPDTDPAPVDAIILLRGSGGYDWKEAIRQSQVFMHFSGRVTYEDIFGNGYETKFRYLWEAEGFDVEGQWQDISHWTKSETDNHAT